MAKYTVQFSDAVAGVIAAATVTDVPGFRHDLRDYGSAAHLISAAVGVAWGSSAFWWSSVTFDDATTGSVWEHTGADSARRVSGRLTATVTVVEA
jgi:hypothetical protein